VIRIDTLWLCTQPQDMRAGADRLLNVVVNTVRADPNLSHCADPILSQGWYPTKGWSAVDKCRAWRGSESSGRPG
jgi:hypothetical protein